MNKMQSAGASGGRQRIYYLDIARAFAVLMICLNHAVNRTYSMYSGQAEEFLQSNFFSQVIKAAAGVASRLGVPLFLMITGVLLLDRFRSGDQIMPFYRKNLKGLWITTEIWYALFFFFILLCKPGNDLAGRGILAIGHRFVRTMLMIEPITLGSMWYMPMILCLYLMIPFFSLAFQHIRSRDLILPGTVLFLSWMLLPNLEQLTGLLGHPISMNPAFKVTYLLSPYLLYMAMGWCIGCRDCLKKLPSPALYLSAIVLFAGICGLQLYGFAAEKDYLLGYEFGGYLVLSSLLLESFRRLAPCLERFRTGIGYLAKISFGIYFVHIPVMELMRWYWNPAAARPVKMGIYWLGSIAVSIAVIAITARSKFLKKYLYYMR